ncbi:RNase P/RNase MRP subunit p30 [Caldisphaera lagunensis DSM 15908]|uniref:RNase P/RNase MRP subunit p30 n=1 Tax=Caldisphaera lagunensis (strain DSM 15908 / JCM 11604 / ANMR 0165 / IC-154) TaxID=1056495 RepID=L0A8I1_CALLD|nr:RNase P/RNase MRP subunit p30 [Caldisphaera lagunensis]AFZ70173.1 RNase P/RNase MRP subunit p30 [Caldisphaera lagunensis DSM 15908]
MKYVDLSINPRNYEEWIKIIPMLKKFNFEIIGMDSNFINDDVLKAAKENSIKVIKRKYFKISNKDELNNILKSSNNSFLVVEPENNYLLNIISQTKTINAIRINLEKNIKINKTIKNLFNINKNGVIEISLKQLLNNDIFLWREMNNLLKNIIKFGLRFYVVSDASNIFELWHPFHVKSLFEILGVDNTYATLSMTTYPYYAISPILNK